MQQYFIIETLLSHHHRPLRQIIMQPNGRKIDPQFRIKFFLIFNVIISYIFKQLVIVFVFMITVGFHTIVDVKALLGNAVNYAQICNKKKTVAALKFNVSSVCRLQMQL